MTKGPLGGLEVFKKRRKKFFEQIKDGVAILSASPEVIRNNDSHYKYRQDSSFYYLSGFTEPESVLFFNPNSKTPFIMFVRVKDQTREIWDGFRYGVEEAGKYFGADKVYPISEFHTVLPELLKGSDKIYYKLGESKHLDETVMSAADEARRALGRSGRGVATFADAKTIVGELRLFKTPEEIEHLRKATEISALGHIRAMRACKPGVYEYELEAEIFYEFRRHGADYLAYQSIVGSGVNATILHYVFNSEECKKDDLLLIDAGAEYGYQSGDITRTFPVSGKFSSAQKKFYETVLIVQKEGVKMVKPGVHFEEIHTYTVDRLVDGMLSLGLLKGNKKEIIDSKTYVKYYPHRTGHWLGMDVHDSGLYHIGGESRKLEPGMCFTVEPGLYVPANDPSEYRSMGVRIEDDVVVTSEGCDVLTVRAPKEVEELESIIGKSH